jgi:glutamyl-tRNA synthetase
VPVHFELFDALGFAKPVYGHIAPIMKMDGESKRKLSKRKDPEASLDFYQEKGYPVVAVHEYLMTILNSNFEDWRRQNRGKPYAEFPVSASKMSRSGALFDLAKLNDISKEIISFLDADEVYAQAMRWAQRYDAGLAARLAGSAELVKAILSIDRGGPKPRKDIAVWSDVGPYLSYFFDETFEAGPSARAQAPECIGPADAREILARFAAGYSEGDDNEAWFTKIRAIASDLGYAADMKAYREAPAAFKGNVGDVSTLIRLAVTGRRNTPDLCRIMKLLGAARVRKRIEDFTALL